MTGAAGVLELPPRARAGAPVHAPIERPLGLKSVAEILADPAALQPPTAVVPRLAWKGRVSLLAGREKTGKSTIAAAGAAIASHGGYFLGEFVDCGNVLWLSADEESPFDQLARFRRFGCEPQNVWLLTAWDHEPASFLRVLREHRPHLAVIDTLAAFAATTIEDAHGSAGWVPLMLALKQAANASETALLLLHHANKSDGRYRDSTAIGGGVDVLLEMTEATDNAVVRRVKARGRWPMDDFSVRLEGDGFELTDNAPSLEVQVYAAVVEQPGLTSNAIHDRVGGRRDDALACLERLGSAGRIENRGGPRKHAWYPATPKTGSVVPVVPRGVEPAIEVSGSRSPIGGTGTTTENRDDGSGDGQHPLAFDPGAK